MLNKNICSFRQEIAFKMPPHSCKCNYIRPLYGINMQRLSTQEKWAQSSLMQNCCYQHRLDQIVES